MSAREQLETIYLDWYNNCLSMETFAEHNGLTYTQAKALIVLARDVAHTAHPDA